MTFICPVCENDEYDEIDGLYYCTVCSTQSQELIKQVVEENFDNEVPCNELWKSRIKTLKKSTGQKKRSDYGRPWTIYEAYQFIIMAQVDAFIDLGAKKDLKEIVFSLWAQYLSKLGVAFCRDEKVVPDIVVSTGIGRQRELHRGTLASPINRIKRSFDELIEPMKAKKAKLSENVPNEQNEDEESGICDKIKERPEKPSPRWTDNIVFVEEVLNNKPLYKKAYTSPEWMDLKKTIAISYLGLRFTNPEIIPADVIRWIYEGKVPYLSTTHLLPNDMVLSYLDDTLFSTTGTNSKQIIYEMNKLCSYLKLKNVPESSPLSLIERFLRELDLPDKLKNICMEVSKNTDYNFPTHKTVYKKPEQLAVMYIGLAVKLLFGLDGNTERKLSSYSVKVRNMVMSNVKIFVFDEWKRHETRKFYSRFDACMDIKRNVMTSSEARHLDKLLQCYNNLQRDEKHQIWQEDHIPIGRRQDFRKLLRTPLSMAVARTGNGQEIKDRNSDFDSGITMAGHEFRNSCLTHIADFPSFKEKFSEQLCKEDCDVLEKEFASITKDVKYTEYAMENDEETLCRTRPRNYVWLLKLLAKMADYSIVTLDQGIIKLHSQLKSNIEKKKIEKKTRKQLFKSDI